MTEESCQEPRKHTGYDGNVQEVCDSVKNEDFSTSNEVQEDYQHKLEYVLTNKIDDTVAQGLFKILNVVKDNPWDWKYNPKRIPGKKVWGRYSMIFPLQHGGCSIGILHTSHLSTNPVHLSQATRVFIPYGCFILFHARLYHYGDKSIMDCGRPHSSVRGFAYVVERDYPVQTHIKS